MFIEGLKKLSVIVYPSFLKVSNVFILSVPEMRMPKKLQTRYEKMDLKVKGVEDYSEVISIENFNQNQVVRSALISRYSFKIRLKVFNTLV